MPIPPPVAKNGHAAPPVDDEEAAARKWIEERARSAAGKSDTAPRINIQDLVDFTGWGRSRCIQFVTLTLDALKPKGAVVDPKERAVGLGALIMAVNEAEHEDDDDELAEAAFPANGENAVGVKRPPAAYILRTGCESLTEYNTMQAAKSAAKAKGADFDCAVWLRGYRARRAAKA